METPTPATKPELPRRPPLWLRSLQQLHSLLHALWFLLLLAAALLAWCWVVGLPDPLAQRLVSRLAADGYTVAVDRIRLDWPAGFTLSGFRMNGPAPLGDAFLQASNVHAEVDWRALKEGRPWMHGVVIRGAHLDWPCQNPDRESERWIANEADLRAELTPERVRIWIDRGSLEGLSITSRVTGRITIDGLHAAARAPGGWQWITHLSERSRSWPATLTAARNYLNDHQVSWGSTPTLDFDMGLDLATDAQLRLDWKARGSHTGLARGVLDAWALDGRYHPGGRLEAKLDAKSHSGSARLMVDWRPDTRTIDLDIRSSLPAMQTLGLMPEHLATAVSNSGLHTVSGFQVALRVPQAPLTNWMEHLRGEVRARSLYWHDLPMEDLYAHFQYSATGFDLHQLRGVAGQGEAAGPFSAKLHLDPASNYVASVMTAFDPRLLQGYAKPGLSNFLQRWTFEGTSPVVRIEVAGHRGTPTTMGFDGTLTTGPATYQTVPFDRISAELHFTNDVLLVSQIDAQRPEGRLTGLFRRELEADRNDLEMSSSIHGEALKRVIGTNFVHQLRLTHFDGPVVGAARGTIGAGPGDARLDISLATSNSVLGKLRIDRLSLDLRVENTRYEFSNIRADAYGGQITGRMALVIATNAPPTYDLATVVTGLSLRALLADLKQGETNLPSGSLSGWAQLRGAVGEGQATSVVGRAALHVRDGDLFQMRVLGALSGLLSSMIPGLGYAKQTEFHSDLKIEKGRCTTQDAMLEGSVVSMRISGSYFFDERVRFVVEVKLLRNGLVASAVRLVTLPVTKLLQFSLSGTLADPQWRPSNLPKEMFLIFD